MKLLVETWNAVVWICEVVRRLFRVSAVPTVVIVFNGIVARLSRFLAFLLPIKVILLAGSGNVPGYFKPLLGNTDRNTAIIVMSCMAVGFYILTLIIEAANKKLAEKGGDALMARSVGMTVIQNQRAEMTGHYGRLTDVVSAMLFVVASLCILVKVELPVALHLPIFCMLALSVTSLIVEPRKDHSQTRLMTFVLDNTSSYIGILSSIAFLTGFAVILYPLLSGDHGSVLRSMIALMLFRQVLSSTRSLVGHVRGLRQQREMIDTLTSPDHRLAKPNEVVDGSLQELFGRARRVEKFRQEMAAELDGQHTIEMHWLDPTFRDANRFTVAVKGGEEPRHLEQHVYPARNVRALENEALLFKNIPRDELFAPPLEARYIYGPFDCVVYDAGTGVAPPTSEWPRIEKAFLLKMCSLQPPKALADAFKSSHLLLAERLRDAAIEKITIATESEEELRLIEAFRTELPALKDELKRLPLCLANPEFRPANLNLRSDGGFYVMNWGQWLIEPFGARLMPQWPDERLNEFIAQARRLRSDVPVQLVPNHIRLVDDCNKLERRLLKGHYKGALASLSEILKRLQSIRAQQEMKLSA